MKLVSIIIPLYNSGEYISDCVKSCLTQSYVNIEILVVNDGSTDNGTTIVKKLMKNDNRIKLYNKTNGGVSTARNMGIEKSKGDYICFIDADDTIEPDFVKVMVNYLEENDADFCFSKNTLGSKKGENGVSEIISSGKAEELLLSQEVIVGCWNKMYRKNILDNIRFREDLFYGEGLYFINQVAHCSKQIVVCDDALYNYRKVNPESATTKFNIEKMVNGEKSLFEIRKFVKKDGRNVRCMWSQHYCLFCINAIKGLLKNDEKDKSFKAWQRKMAKNLPAAMLSKGSLKMKIYITLLFAAPKLLCRKK